VDTWTKTKTLYLIAALVVSGCQSHETQTSPEEDAWCTDIASGEGLSCGEQVGSNRCDELALVGFCNRSCGRCDGIGESIDACVDTPPAGEFSCEQQASWDKCDEPWMAGFCQLSCGTCPIGTQLIDPEAYASTRRLMSYLVSVHGNSIISGQQNRADAEHMAAITGRFPALVGFDLMDYSPSRVALGASSDETDQALNWWQVKGGIVALTWHWNAPANLIDSEEYPWWRGFYSAGTTFDLAKAMNDRDSSERKLIIRDIDAIAVQLQRLENADVPILWRPTHEASGKWFWWGAHGAEVHKALWRLLYDRLVNHHELHNLIWVWNGQDGDWYPGNQYVDIVSEDIYEGERNYGPQEFSYRKARRYAGTGKLIALSETGALLDPTLLSASSARWSWFMLWSGDYATEEVWNEDSMKKKVYESPFVITLDELTLTTSP
jgi:mannan endo-1,4-beta-mannosidase